MHHLLLLPPELRLQILFYLVCIPPTPYQAFPLDLRLFHISSARIPPICQVNRQLRREATALFYTSNENQHTLHCYDDGLKDTELPLLPYADQLKSVRVSIYVPTLKQYKRTNWWPFDAKEKQRQIKRVEQFFTQLKGLRSVDIRLETERGQYNDELGWCGVQLVGKGLKCLGRDTEVRIGEMPWGATVTEPHGLLEKDRERNRVFLDALAARN
ncbi:MAG: hypothetical protein M1820_008620 [Bogoriella megaspora]|nr:MAG: hypothetical protein M1820_008620 [Bogoriella megaspora]